jgi:hypothetical protein
MLHYKEALGSAAHARFGKCTFNLFGCVSQLRL